MSATIIVTGVGAIIGQGILNAFRSSGLDVRLVGADSNARAVGFKWTDASCVIPMANDPAWLKVLTDICKKENAVALIPGIEQDIRAYMNNKDAWIGQCQTRFMVNSDEALSLGTDKWELYRAKDRLEIELPNTWLLEDFYSLSSSSDIYPVLLKPRRGMAGKGIHRANSKKEFEALMGLINPEGYLVQRYIGTDDEEYTGSVFAFSDGSLSRPIAFKRTLNYGSTFEAETIESEALNETVISIASKIKLSGPTNFQFRKSGDKYLLLEINPRFSSSTSIKAAFGFNEAEMLYKNFILGEAPTQPQIKQGTCSRYIKDDIKFS